MRKNWIFWPDDRPEYNKNNPYSGITGSTPHSVRWWIATLFSWNPSANTIFYMIENGRKIYSANREDYGV